MAAGDQVAQHGVQAAGHLGPQGAQVPTPLGPQLQYRGVVLGCHRAHVFGAQRGDRHRAGVVGVVLIGVAGGQQPYPGSQFRLHIQDNFAGGHELLGQQVAEASGTLDGPSAPWPLLRPGHQPVGLVGRRAHPQLAQHLFGLVDRHCGVRSFVGVNTDHHCHDCSSFHLGKWGRGRHV